MVPQEKITQQFDILKEKIEGVLKENARKIYTGQLLSGVADRIVEFFTKAGWNVSYSYDPLAKDSSQYDYEYFFSFTKKGEISSDKKSAIIFVTKLSRPRTF